MSKKCTPLWREVHFQVKMYKTHHCRTTFGSYDVEKVHAVVARSTFPSQNVQSTSASDHFWKLRCRKSARRCGAKHISKSKCTKHTTFGPLLEAAMSKKCTPLWREAHFQVKIYKHTMHRPFLEVQMSFRVAGARDFGPCQKWAKRDGFVAFSTTITITLHYTPMHYTTTTTTTTPSLHSTTLHYTALNYTTPHYITLHYTPLQFITLHYITLHSTTLHYTTFHYTSLHYTTLHYTTTTTAQLHSTTPHYTKLHYTKLHYTTLHSTTLHYTPLH